MGLVATRSPVPAAVVTEPGDPADRLALHELVARHGHLVDAGDFAGLAEVFTASGPVGRPVYEDDAVRTDRG